MNRMSKERLAVIADVNDVHEPDVFSRELFEALLAEREALEGVEALLETWRERNAKHDFRAAIAHVDELQAILDKARVKEEGK